MSFSVLGTCGACGGRVVLPTAWYGIYPPTPYCSSCGRHAKASGPVIDMAPLREPGPQPGSTGDVPDYLIPSRAGDLHLFIIAAEVGIKRKTLLCRLQRGVPQSELFEPPKPLLGAEHPTATLTAELVREIRQRNEEGEPTTRIAQSLGLPQPTVYRAAKRQTYKNA